MLDRPTPPSGESAPPSLEEPPACTAYYCTLKSTESAPVYQIAAALDESATKLLARAEAAEAEVARLTAERDAAERERDARRDRKVLCEEYEARVKAAEARAARAEEALGELVAAVDALDATNLLAPEWDAMKARYNAAVLDARRALTEGADR